MAWPMALLGVPPMTSEALLREAKKAGSFCDPECEGRCRTCPDDLIRALIARVEALDKDYLYSRGDLATVAYEQTQRALDLQQRLTEALATVDYHNELLADAGKDYYRERRRADAAEASLRQVTAERDEARKIVALINNEVIGSAGYFTTPSCVMAVQELKEYSNQRQHRLTTLLAAIEQVEGLPPHTFPDTGDRQFIDRNATLQALRSSQETR